MPWDVAHRLKYAGIFDATAAELLCHHVVTELSALIRHSHRSR
jgi:hypothetical protein